MSSIKEALRRKLVDLLTFIYNKQTKEVLGRTALSWGTLKLIGLSS